MTDRAKPESVVLELLDALAESIDGDELELILETKRLIEATANVTDVSSAQTMFRELVADANRD